MAAQPADVTSGQSEVSLGPMAAGWQDGRTGLPAMGHALLYSLESLPFPASPTTPHTCSGPFPHHTCSGSALSWGPQTKDTLAIGPRKAPRRFGWAPGRKLSDALRGSVGICCLIQCGGSGGGQGDARAGGGTRAGTGAVWWGGWGAWVPAQRSNQPILKEISPENSLERSMMKLKLQYFGYLMQS